MRVGGSVILDVLVIGVPEPYAAAASVCSLLTPICSTWACERSDTESSDTRYEFKFELAKPDSDEPRI